MRALVAILLLSFGFKAFAIELKCNNCSESTYQSKALNAGVGTHYIYDLVKGYSRKYDVSRSCEEGLVCYKEVTQYVVEPDVTYIVTELAAYYTATAGQMGSWFTWNADGAIANMTAFDAAGPGGPRTQLLDWFTNKSVSLKNALPASGVAVQSLLQTAINIFKNNVGLTKVTVVFIDGSKITLEYDPVNDSVGVVEGSAVDKLGNVIPVTAQNFNGLRFDYSGEPGGPAQQRMDTYIKIFGDVKITGSTHWVCVSDGITVHCSPY